MQMAITVGDCTGDDADLLRRAMGSKRGVEKIESAASRSCTPAWPRHGITGDAGRRHLRQDPGLRQLRLRREPRASASRCWSTPRRGSSCTTRRAFLAGAAARPADGLLLAAVAGRRRPAARRRGAPARHRPVRRRTPTSRPSTPAASARPASTSAAGPVRAAPSRCRSTRPTRTRPASTAATARFAVRLGLTEVRGIGADVARADRRRARADARSPT